MKKDLYSEQWSRRIGYALTLLVLLDCIVPFTWNAWHGRPASGLTRIRSRGHPYAMTVVDALAKAAKGKNLWPNNEFGLDSGFEEDGLWKTFGLKGGSNKLSGVQLPDEAFRRNLTVFILPDLRRTTGVNENVAAVASNQELSLQDSDAIDFYWRQDIDAEKGLYPNLWSPDLQYERDVQLVTEKTLLQPGYTDTTFRHIPDQTDFLRDFIQAQKDQLAAFDALPTSSAAVDNGKSGGWQSGKPFVFESTATEQQQPSSTDTAYDEALDQLDLEWLNSSAAVDPMVNGGFLDNSIAQTDGYNVDQGSASSEYNFLTTANNVLNTPPVSMEWESRPDVPVNTNGLEENRADPLFSGLFSSIGFESLPTPDLLLAPNDVACIFGDSQVLQDVVEAQTTKDMLLYHSPIAAIETMPSTSGTEIMTFIPANFDENNLGEQEQSEVFIESMPPYGDPFAVPPTSWPQTAPSVPAWHPQATANPNGALSVSPTYSGDHDYTLDATSGEINHTTDWSHDDGVVVKSEVDYYDEDEEEEDSSEQRARAASERDEARARQLNLPFSAAEIVTMSQQEYVALTRSKGRFTREQLELVKEIRRHGGNKEAARRSRQKKVQMSKQLEDEVTIMERERNAILAEHRRLLKEIEMEERAIEEMKRKNMRQ